MVYGRIQERQSGSVQAEGGKDLILRWGRYTSIPQTEIGMGILAAQSVIRKGRHEKVFICTDNRAITVFQSMRIEAYPAMPQDTE